ncbi:sugar phosphate isomerase/epimerase [Clostridium tyrobutyricum]|uniref:sugar phosphate isomerase/epimerase family protein n=1 Tax=Clostridium tyrobutyricum TaxID=1519 RepID=UPI001C38B446|nr:TIM barrel protein [Clostridium tyrobutyricum]MBV4419327.1 sugar phosphate isomerase/epimerase [Clostridium tyrobutyricum]
MTDIRLGMNTSFALNRYPLTKEWMDIIADDLKIKYVQFYFDLLDPVIIEQKVRDEKCYEIREYSKKKGIIIQSTATGAISHQSNFLLHPDKKIKKSFISWYKKGIYETSLIGSESMGVYVGAFSMADIKNEKRKNQLLDEYVDIMSELSVYAKQNGLKYLLIEPMSIPREYPSTIEETKYIYNKLNASSDIPIYLNLDVGHLNINSSDPADGDTYAWIRELLKYSKVLHLQQTKKGASLHAAFTKENNNDGIIDGKKVIDEVVKTNIREIYLTMELFFKPIGLNDNIIISSLKESVDYWKDIIDTYKSINQK